MMLNIYEILNIDISSTSIRKSSNILSPIYTVKLFEKQKNRLQKVRDAIGENQFKITNDNLIPHVFNKFKSIIKSNDLSALDTLDRRELRTIAYALSYSEINKLSIFSQPEELSLVLFALKLRWKPSFLIGLLDCYLKNWRSKNNISIEKIGDFIKQRLYEYDGDRTILNTLKSNIKFFDYKKGDIELGKTLAITNNGINEATKYLKLPESWFSYPYFSMVIMAFFEQKKKNLVEIIGDLENVLTIHNYSVTNQRLISQLLILVNSKNETDLQDKVKSIAFNFIGDPEKYSSKWIALPELNDQEKNDLIESKKILNHWITLRFISVFFELCINDPDRKKFWIKIAPKISAFKIIGSRHTKSILLRDKRISEFVNETRFSSTQVGNASALLMVINNYILIEFSEAGYAFYAFKKSSVYAPKLDARYSSVNELRNGDLPMLIYADGSENSEGRMTHRNNSYRPWQTIFANWLRDYVRI